MLIAGTVLGVTLLTGCRDTLVKNVLNSGRQYMRISAQACIGCGACWEVCPENAISEARDGERYIYVIDPEKCTACGACLTACQYSAINRISEE